jgi:hypothetical protein
MNNPPANIRQKAMDYFAQKLPGPDEQTYISCFLSTLKMVNASILSKIEMQPIEWIPYSFLHNQYYKEVELSTLLLKDTQWSINPFVYSEAAMLNTMVWQKADLNQYFTQIFTPDRLFFQYLAITHGFLSEIRLFSLFPPNVPLDNKFISALYAIEVENGRQIQIQIRLLKDMEVPLSENEKEDIVNKQRLIVADLFDRLLTLVCRNKIN